MTQVENTPLVGLKIIEKIGFGATTNVADNIIKEKRYLFPVNN